RADRNRRKRVEAGLIGYLLEADASHRLPRLRKLRRRQPRSDHRPCPKEPCSTSERNRRRWTDRRRRPQEEYSLTKTSLATLFCCKAEKATEPGFDRKRRQGRLV